MDGYMEFLLQGFQNLTPMNWTVIKHALNFLWQGLLAIFVVIGLIVIAVKITNYIIVKSDEAKKSREETQQNDTQSQA